MNWLFDRKGKSIATSAQRVVADMHAEIDMQNKKIKELEKTIFKFKNMCTESLERDITRLESRKRELISELESIDDLILAAQERLKSAKDEVSNVLQPIERKTTSHNRRNPLEEQYLEERDLCLQIHELGDVLFFIHSNAYDEIFVYMPSYDISKLVVVTKCKDKSHIKEIVELTKYEQMIAYGPKIVPNNERDFPDITDIPIPISIATAPPRTTSSTMTSSSTTTNNTYKGTSNNSNNNSSNGQNKMNSTGAVSSSSDSSTSSNSHQMNGSHIKNNIKEGSSINSTNNNSSSSMKSQEHSQDNNNNNNGTLQGAFEIPLIPGLIIDIWKELQPPYRYWATTPIDGIGFAVLERLYLEFSHRHSIHLHKNRQSQHIHNHHNKDENAEDEDDDEDDEDSMHNPLLEASLFGRHPTQGTLLMERVQSGDPDEYNEE